MTPLLFVLTTFDIALVAGLLGSLLGLGGGIIVVPTLTLLLHVAIRLAIGASIISIIASHIQPRRGIKEGGRLGRSMRASGPRTKATTPAPTEAVPPSPVSSAA